MTTVRKNVLVVDDDPDLRKLLSIRLGAAGYAITEAESAEQALAHLAIGRPHLVITDLRMSGMDGMALFDNIHRINPALPVIILTAHGSIPEAVSATKRGVFGFIPKPFDSKALLAQVEKALALTGNAPQPGADQDKDNDTWRRGFITRSPAMEDMLSQAMLVAAGDASVFIQGESGTGKELLAKAIHRASPRRDKPFVAVNCSAIPESLLESELFGHCKGSFTGATQNAKGLFQAAHGGTLFLDEIGDMPMVLQVKLLRALEEKEVRPVGSTETIPVNVRVISATHRNLEAEKEAGRFRGDLYYRLNVVCLRLPPLSERREDIPLLAAHFLQSLAEKYRKKINGFSPEALELLVHAAWPGNVRQLSNVVEQTVVLCTTPIIPATLVQRALRDTAEDFASFEEAKKRFERDYLVQLLKITNGNVSEAARRAKRNRTEFYKLLKRHHLSPALFKQRDH